MYRANWLLAIFILLVGIPLAPAAADDASVCATATGDEAVNACSRIIESGQTRGRELAVIYRHRGIALRIKGDNDRSIADLDAAIRLNPKFVSALANRGIVWRNKGDLDRSIADLDAAIQLDPKNAFAFFHRAFTWGVKGERDRAIADYSEAIRLNPKDAVAFNNRGNLWKDKRDLDRAFADYNEAIRLNPKYSMAYNNRGLAWNTKRDLDRAISDYDEAIRLDPKYAPVYNNRGIAWKDKGQLDRAISDYDVAIRLDPKNALARSNRGSSWRTKRDFDRAITDYNEAIRLDPNYSAAITGRGLVYESKGERDRARANFEMALALPPKYDSGKWAQDTARTRLALLPPAKTPSVVAPGPSPAISTDRIALVIGNGAYVNAPPLPNPPNDARAIGRALRGIGFTVIDGTDLDHSGMERTIVDFLRKASLARIAVVFYAGHGVQIDGKNYLVPIDAKSMMRSTVTFELIDVDRILASLDDEARANIIILDACRDNPLETRLATRSAARGAGLAGYSTVASGMLIAFATAPGMTAADGTGQNSPFTTALIKHIGTPGLEINQLLNRVRKDVVDATSRQQIPWTNSSLLGDVVLTDGKPSAAAHP